MISRLLALIAVACCLLVGSSFLLFARDQVAGASKHQQNELIAGAPSTSGTNRAHHVPAQPRRFIDDAAHALTSPFRNVVESNSQWVTHGVSTVLALLVYGLGIGYVARFSRGLS